MVFVFVLLSLAILQAATGLFWMKVNFTFLQTDAFQNVFLKSSENLITLYFDFLPLVELR